MSLESWTIVVFYDEVKVVNLLIITEKITVKFGRAKTAKSAREQHNTVREKTKNYNENFFDSNFVIKKSIGLTTYIRISSKNVSQ